MLWNARKPLFLGKNSSKKGFDFLKNRFYNHLTPVGTNGHKLKITGGDGKIK